MKIKLIIWRESMALSKIEMEIIDILHDRNISRDDILGFTSVLDIKHAHDEMLKWLKENPKAGYEEILDKILEIYQTD